MKSTDIATLRDYIKSIEVKKKRVKITCENKTAGDEVREIVRLHSASLSGGGEKQYFQPIIGGISNKDFTIRFKTEEAAETFKNNLQAIVDGTAGDEIDVDPVTGEPYPAPEESNPHTLLIIAILIIVAAIGVFVWKKRR